MKDRDKKKGRTCRKCGMTLHATATEIQNHERSHTQTIIERPLITIAPAGTLERLEAIQREKQLQNRHMLPYKLK